MNDFFGELARQLAGRWLTLLAIPSVLFLTVGWVGLQLGHSDPFDLHRLTDAVGAQSSEIARWPGATQVLAVVGLLLTAVTLGLLVQALAGPVRAVSLGQWPGPLGHLGNALAQRRRHRWAELSRERAALEKVHPRQDRTASQQHRIDQLAGQANQIALAEPHCPTWMGDRVHALGQVALNRYGLDLSFSWPRLWLVLPDAARAEINTAHAGFATAILTTAWSVPYLALALLWWPAALAGVMVAAVGRARARTQITTCTELVESAIDVHGRDLAIIFGVADPTSTGPLTREEGHDITDIARKGR